MERAEWLDSGDFFKQEPPYNAKISEREKQNPKHARFLEWCFSNGLKWSGVDFPAFFGKDGNLRGLVAKRDIRPYEVVLAVPNQLMITTIKAREDKYLGKLFAAHEELFFAEDTGEYNCLIVYLLRERFKGEESFFAPFLNVVSETESALVWDQQTLDFIEENSLRQEVVEAQEEFQREWKQLKAVLDKYPNMFPKVTIADFAWANQFVTTRCFGWYLPCTLLCPMVDLVNHYAKEQCTTEILHLGLEREEDAAKRKLINYRKIRGNYDVGLLIPESKFVPGEKKSKSALLVESFDRKLHDHQKLLPEQVDKMALQTAISLLADYEDTDIWDIPDWESYCKEDNDSSSEEEDAASQDEDFTAQVDKLKAKLRDKPRKVEAPLKPLENYDDILRESAKRRAEVMNFEVSRTTTPSTYDPNREAVVGGLDCADSESDYQTDYPWYSTSDKEIYYVIANNKNKVIPAGTELKVSYGSRTNRYLAVWYGFALLDNCYDSYVFRIVVDETVAKNAGLRNGVLSAHITPEQRKQGFVTHEGYIISTQLITTPFRAKLNELNLQLVAFLRGHLYQQWVKDRPQKKKAAKFSLSIPSDLSFELHVMKRYLDVFTGLLLQFRRSDDEDVKLLRNSKALTGPIAAIVTCELGWKRIIYEHIRLARLTIDLLKELKSSPYKRLKDIYLKRLESDLPGMDYLESRFKLKRYLKRLYLSPSVQSSF